MAKAMNPNGTVSDRPQTQPASQNRPAAQHRPAEDILTYLRDYAREQPEAAALWCFGIGFVLGWKLKPW